MENKTNRNDRERPYSGQIHTHNGERGQAKVRTLTVRDVTDCIYQGFLKSSDNLQKKTVEINKEFQGTKYASDNTWSHSDIYKIEGDLDFGAVIQNTVCFIEHMMGTFPNTGIPPELIEVTQ